VRTKQLLRRVEQIFRTGRVVRVYSIGKHAGGAILGRGDEAIIGVARAVEHVAEASIVGDALGAETVHFAQGVSLGIGIDRR
jgi:hypothetical protein